MGDFFIWLFFFLIVIAILAMLVFQLIALIDLEFDYINPYQTASRINRVVLPEFTTQGVLCFLYLITGHWVISLYCVPCLYYNVKLYTQRRHLIDVTEIFNMLSWEKKQRIFKLVHTAILLVISLFWVIYSALELDEFDL
ncbi:Protein cornichon -like protein 4 [Capsicum baccatum]|uniref:Protein cornichon-like protein 4 n=1 Tax=Capsicum baccatum TaxID=33114 RepID=A0A2G2W2R9_CAPBA|nr:Protein cornichon -like protein 4 [Capsicum baccatum]